MRLLPKLSCVLLMCISTSCLYNFKGISIPPDIKTFYVETFSIPAEEAPGDLNQLFTEEFRRKIREETRLVNNNENPDIVFSGSIVKYEIDYVAPDPDNTTSLNRLEISVKINYVNENNEEDNYSKSYSDFEDFDSNTNFRDIQEELNETIIDDILERVFNDAFTGW